MEKSNQKPRPYRWGFFVDQKKAADGMDFGFQDAFNVALALCGTLFGILLATVKQSISNLQQQDKSLADKVQAIEVLVAGQYVKRDDFDRFADKVFTKLDAIQRDHNAGIGRIEEKLNSKADK